MPAIDVERGRNEDLRGRLLPRVALEGPTQVNRNMRHGAGDGLGVLADSAPRGMTARALFRPAGAWIALER
jgi:hypothetical protein